MTVHVPVLVKETLEMLDVRENGIYVDATLGLGGHSEAILGKLGSSGMLVGIDRDDDALQLASERLGNKRVNIKKGSFSEMGEILSGFNVGEIDGVVFDLGLSMLQLKDKKRGFSFLSEERLDMRMDPSQDLTAWDVVNRYPEKDIERILREYGEERLAGRIAKAISAGRRKSHISTCAELAGLVMDVYGGRGRIHPATRTFQALRIEVNRELDELKTGLAVAAGRLRSGGRMCVISYHSLEDRIVKNFFRGAVSDGSLRKLSKKPLVPGAEETRTNPSSRSAKLRGAEKI